MSNVHGFKEQALTVLQSLINAATQAGDFLKEQIPLVVQELLMYYTVQYCVLILVSLSLLGVGIWFHKRLHKKGMEMKEEREYDSGSVIGSSWAVLIVSILVFGGSFVSCLLELIKVLLAPRLWLLEYATNLVK